LKDIFGRQEDMTSGVNEHINISITGQISTQIDWFFKDIPNRTNSQNLTTLLKTPRSDHTGLKALLAEVVAKNKKI